VYGDVAPVQTQLAQHNPHCSKLLQFMVHALRSIGLRLSDAALGWPVTRCGESGGKANVTFIGVVWATVPSGVALVVALTGDGVDVDVAMGVDTLSAVTTTDGAVDALSFLDCLK
jgi:hypothetical protein